MPHLNLQPLPPWNGLGCSARKPVTPTSEWYDLKPELLLLSAARVVVEAQSAVDSDGLEVEDVRSIDSQEEGMLCRELTAGHQESRQPQLGYGPLSGQCEGASLNGSV